MLIGAGGSAHAEAAVRVGARVARALEAQVVLLAVEEEGGEPVREVVSRCQGLLETLGIHSEIRIRKGSPAREILQETQEGYDLLVIGSHGRHGIREFFLGSDAIQIVEHVKISTLVVREDRGPYRILMCERFKREPRPYVVELVGRLARGLGASVTLLNVIPFPTLYGIDYIPEPGPLLRRHPERADYLRRVSEMFQDMGVRVRIRVREGLPEEEILQEAREGDYDLLVVGSSRKAGLVGLLQENFSYTLVKHAKISVLVVAPERK